MANISFFIIQLKGVFTLIFANDYFQPLYNKRNLENEDNTMSRRLLLAGVLSLCFKVNNTCLGLRSSDVFFFGSIYSIVGQDSSMGKHFLSSLSFLQVLLSGRLLRSYMELFIQSLTFFDFRANRLFYVDVNEKINLQPHSNWLNIEIYIV